MKKTTLLTGSLLALLTCSPPASAQAPDAIRKYQQQAGPRSILYRARQANIYPFSFNGTPYWEHDDFLTGDIVSEGRTYYGISFRIDAHVHQLVVRMEGSPFTVALPPEQVSSIATGDRRFEGVGPDQALEEGFYEVFGEGRERVYKRIDKPLQSSVNNVNGSAIGYDDPSYRNEVLTYFAMQKSYYFRDAEGKISGLRGKSSLLKHFPERKAELRKAVKNAGLKWKDFDACCKLVLNLTSR